MWLNYWNIIVQSQCLLSKDIWVMCAVSQAWIFLFWVCPSCSPLPKHGVLLSWASVWHPRVSSLDTRNCTFTPTDCWPSKQLPLSAKNQYINISLCVFICKQWFVKTVRSLNGVIKVFSPWSVYDHVSQQILMNVHSLILGEFLFKEKSSGTIWAGKQEHEKSFYFIWFTLYIVKTYNKS